MFAFAALDFVSMYEARRLAGGERLRNDLFRVGWDVKPQLKSQTLCYGQLTCTRACIEIAVCTGDAQSR